MKAYIFSLGHISAPKYCSECFIFNHSLFMVHTKNVFFGSLVKKSE